MGTVSRGFKGRRRPSVELPPGQYLVEDFPVLSAGPTPSIDLQDWEFVIAGETRRAAALGPGWLPQHRFPLQLDHRGQRPPVDPAAQDRGRRQGLPGRVVRRLRASPQGLHPGRGRRRRARPIRGPPARRRGGQQLLDQAASRRS
jgi:hypothetical protein